MISNYSQEYKQIKYNAEHNWPQWKIDYYNKYFATSSHAKKIAHNEKSLKMSRSIYCCECESLIDIDKSQDGGYCDEFGGFHKFTVVCPYMNHKEYEVDIDE